MELILSCLLIFSITLGQLIRIPVGLGGLTILDLVVSFLIIIGLLKSRFLLKSPPFFVKTAGAFIFVGLISLLLTPLSLTLNEFFLSGSYLIRFLIYIIFGWLVYSKILFRDVKLILYSSGIIFVFLGLLQFIFFPNINFLTKDGWDPHYFRVVGSFLDPNFTGAFLVLTLIILTDNFQKNQKILFALAYITLLLTFSRESYVMFLTSFICLSALRKSMPLFIVTIILSSGLFLGFYSYQQTVANPRNIDRTKSAALRLNSWQQGLNIFQKNPILGVGFNTYRYALRQYNLTPEQFIQSRGSSYNDSSLVHVAATTGVIGLFVYLFFLFSLLKSSLNNDILVAGLAGLIIQSFFANILFYPFLLLWIMLALRFN